MLIVEKIDVLYQIVGTLILGWSIGLTPNHIIKAMAGTYFGYNKHVLAALVEQQNDTRFVFVLLCGIFLQIIVICEIYKIIALFALVLILCSFVLIRKRITRSITAKLSAELDVE